MTAQRASQPSDQRGALKIGAVARITGVSTHTIRKWEERYGAVEPKRSPGGERIYTRIDLERLVMIKRLADAGLSLTEIAPLPLEELTATGQDILAMAMPQPTLEPAAQMRVALLGTSWHTIVDRTGSHGLLQVVAQAHDANALIGALSNQPVDVLIVDCPAIRRDTRRVVTDLARRLEVRGTVLLYRFAARGDVLALQSPGTVTLQAPVDERTLQQAVQGILRPGERVMRTGLSLPQSAAAEIPAPRLSPEIIARAIASSPKMRCECPHHLSQLILNLRAFEDYSAECESRDDDDAALHHYLWRSAAQARALFEDAIERVAAAEGISLQE